MDKHKEIWFYNAFSQEWMTLHSVTSGNSRESEGFVGVPHQWTQLESGPFTHITTAVYYEDAI